MINNLLSDDSKAILLICSDIVKKYSNNEKLKPLTINEWNLLSRKILNSQMKSPKAFFNIKSNEWRGYIDISEEEVERIDNLLKQSSYLGFELERLLSMGIWITTRAEETYPSILKSRLKHKAPVILFCSGESKLFEQDGVAIVGSRNIDEKAIKFSENIAKKCANEGLKVISGGAKGVDLTAQNSALNSGGRVISIVADSMSKVIKKKEFREAILENKLLVISPFNPESTFKVYNAMDRNKYVYALSKFAIVVSSDYKKGGTWNGALENLKNCWVPLYVRDVEEAPIGNKELIKLGAKPLDANKIEDSNFNLIDILADDKKEKKVEQIDFFSLNS